jgi:hypothetical protein
VEKIGKTWVNQRKSRKSMHRPEEKIGKQYAGNKYFRTMSYITDLISW